MRGKLMILALTALAVGVIAAGCGGDDDDTAASSLTKEEWVAQADEICTQGNNEISRQAGEFFRNGETPAKLEKFNAQVVLPSIEEQVAGVKALGVPEGDEEEVEAIISAAEEGIAQAQEDPSALEKGALDEATRLMAEYGAKVCGQA